MTSFYIASKFDNKEKVLALMKVLEGMGHTISHKWVYQKGAYTEDAAQQAQLDYMGVRGCENFVALLDKPFTPHVNTYVELGIALGSDKCIFVIGAYDKDCIFSRMAGITRCETVKQFIALMHQIYGKEVRK